VENIEVRQPRSLSSAPQRAGSHAAPTLKNGDREDEAVEAVASRGSGFIVAWAACAVGLLYAVVSIYWGLGGTWLLDTVGGSLAKLGRAHSAGVIAAVWGAAALKLIAAPLPLLAIRHRGSSRLDRGLSVLAWVAAGLLIVYGLVLTVAGLLVQTGVIHASSTADHRALAWHAYLWDPWFLTWGLLIAAALLLAGRARSESQS
jgi:hypothetical protein